MFRSVCDGKIALFDKALVEALACGALAMCLQIGWAFIIIDLQLP